MTIAALIVMFLLPALFVFLSNRVAFFRKIGVITLCYATGFLISVIPIGFDKDLTQTVASVLVALAIPLILFGFDITEVKSLAKKTVIAFALMILSVMAVSSVAAVVANSAGMEESSALAGMATGLYIGGTPNMFAVGAALLNDVSRINLVNVADSLVGGVYILLVFSVVAKLYRRLLGGNAAESQAVSVGEPAAPDPEYDYRSIPRDRKSILRLVGVILLAVASLGIGVALELLINGSLDGSLFIIVTVSVLGIAVSFIRPVREVKGSYQIGQYLILVFSLGLGMSIDWNRMVSALLPTLLFFFCAQMGCILVHLLLCKLFRVDGGTALITSIAGVYGPPFIAPTANAYGDRSLIVPGVICGTLGLAVGNLLGIGLGNLLFLIL